MRLPPPNTFAEGQRAIALWLMAAAGIFCGFGTIGVILLLWRGGWSPRTEPERIMYVAVIGMSYALGMISVILALAVGGPVGRFRVSAGRDGVTADLDDHDDPAPPIVTTTTEVH